MAERVRVREIDDDEGGRLVRIVRRGSGSVVTWRRAQMVMLSAQGMDVPAIARVAFTSEDRVRDVIRNFNADGFGSLYPRYKGGRPPKFTLPQRRKVKKIAKAKPAEYDLPFSTWSLAKLADFLVAEGVVDDISHEGLRVLLRQEGVTFQRLKTWKASKDPRYVAKKARVEQLHAIADREAAPGDGDPEIVFCVDEFGPLNLQPRLGRQWAAVSGKNKEPVRCAHRLFAEHGYEATTMASIAAAAGVAVQTVYFVFHTKAELLREVCRTAVLGEDQLPPEEQAWYQDLGREADGAEVLARFVANIAPIAARTAPISAVIREVRDPDALAVYHDSESRRRDAYRQVIGLLARDDRLRPGLDPGRATDILMLLAGPQSFLVLVHDYGWAPDTWVTWTAGVLAEQLL